MTINAELIRSLWRSAHDAVAEHIAEAPYVALLDFPDHSNVGDSAIWVGEVELIQTIRGRGPDYVCSLKDFDAEALASEAPEGPILLHGGGNMGDLWPEHQEFREHICRLFPQRPIVQLPQTVWFQSEQRQAEAWKRLAHEKNFHLMVRDQPSLERVSTLDCPTRLVPDMAFGMLPLTLRQRPHYPLVALLRTDAEKKTLSGAHDLPENTLQTDWLDEPVTDLWALHDIIASRSSTANAYTRVAEARLARGLALIASGKAIVTDRLHGLILALLLGRPHYVLDNSYGKLQGFVDTWIAQNTLSVCSWQDISLERWWSERPLEDKTFGQ